MAKEVTAEIAAMQVRFAIERAKAHLRKRELCELASLAALGEGCMNTAGRERMQKVSTWLLESRQAAIGYARELENAGFDVIGDDHRLRLRSLDV